jgi:predicted  nucleic acid-binding Zn-ribbon protein
MKHLLLAFTVVGCGFSANSTDIGREANGARDYFSSRGIDGESLGDSVQKASDDAGEQANAARQHMSDRNISGEDFQNFTDTAADDINDEGNRLDDKVSSQLVAAKNEIGEQANEARDYMYPRGIEEMRHGDKGLTNQADDSSSRIVVLEGISKLHTELLMQLFDLTAAESAARENADNALQEGISGEAAARSAADDALALDIQSSSSQLQSYIATIEDALNTLTGRVSTNEADIADAQAELFTLNQKVMSLRNKVRQLKQLTRMHTRQIARLKNKLYNEKQARISDVFNLQGQLSTLSGVVSSLSTDMSSAQSAITSLENAMTAVENALDDDNCHDLSVSSHNVAIYNQYDGDCGHGIGVCDENDFDKTVYISIPVVSCN